MSRKNKDATQRLLAIIVIIAMMLTMGIPLPVILFFAIVIYFVWRAVQQTERQDVERVFDFYIAASEILRDDERRWYGFEIARVMREGENLLHEMRDPPPLVHFALGALAHRVGEYPRAAEHLAFVAEEDDGDETHRLTASPELRRYVEVLRQLEREPAQGPQTMAAIRSLERTRAVRLESLLAESRERAAKQLSEAKTAVSLDGSKDEARVQPLKPAPLFAVADDPEATVSNVIELQTKAPEIGDKTLDAHRANDVEPTQRETRNAEHYRLVANRQSCEAASTIRFTTESPVAHTNASTVIHLSDAMSERVAASSSATTPPDKRMPDDTARTASSEKAMPAMPVGKRDPADSHHDHHTRKPISELLRDIYDEEKKTA